MSNNLLNLVGLAKKAGKLEVGEEPVGGAARAGQKTARAVRKAGIEILRRLPGGEGRSLARLLAKTNRASWDAELIPAVWRELERR